jgi:alpha-glucosidase
VSLPEDGGVGGAPAPRSEEPDRGARGPRSTEPDPWWRAGVVYQIYPRSFADSNGDGIGDLGGIIGGLDYLAWLGIDGIWLNPVTCSPNADWGYDVSDYRDVSPEYGTLDQLVELVQAASLRGIRVLMDLVPNHTSDRHAWFVDARSSPESRFRDWYVWAEPENGKEAPNNWVSSFGGPAWTRDELSGQMYLHNFLPEQPDLNWWNEEVADEFDEILRFWFDKGVSGFRIDVCNMIVKDRQLRDNPPATEEDDWLTQIFGQRSVFNSNRPEVHEVMRRWREIAESYEEPRLLLGETNIEDLQTMASYYGKGDDELHLAFNFPFIESTLDANAMSGIVATIEELLPRQAWPVWTGSNHDIARFATSWAGGDRSRTRVAMMMLLALRGTAVLYQGDEIGLTATNLEREELLDPVGLRFWPAYAGRDQYRTPMHWTAGVGAGFTAPGVKPWLPFGDLSVNVETQQGDAGSLLHLTRDLLSLRRSTPDLGRGSYLRVSSPDGTWRWRRGTTVEVALNLSEQAVTVADLTGRVLIGTDRGRDGARLGGETRLGPWEGVVVERATSRR